MNLFTKDTDTYNVIFRLVVYSFFFHNGHFPFFREDIALLANKPLSAEAEMLEPTDTGAISSFSSPSLSFLPDTSEVASVAGSLANILLVTGWWWRSQHIFPYLACIRRGSTGIAICLLTRGSWRCAGK